MISPRQAGRVTTFTIRPATAADAAELARLLTALGYPMTLTLAVAVRVRA